MCAEGFLLNKDSFTTLAGAEAHTAATLAAAIAVALAVVVVVEV